MVYRGKPSKGCGLCRKRKIKCDQTEPSCGQCLRARKTCPGYRDLQALMFHDESQDVIRKIQRKSLRRPSPDSAYESGDLEEDDDVIIIDRSDHSPSSTDSLDWSSNVSQDVQILAKASKSQALCQSLGQNLEDTATAFFFQNYVANNGGTKRGFMDYIPLVFQTSPARGALTATIVSVGMAGLSNITSNPEMLVQAREKYDQALALTRHAIISPDVAKSDDLLASVLMLSLFEAITCKTVEAVDQWTDHIQGVIALLCLRGPQQLETVVGRQIFFIARAQIIISCLQTERYVPESISHLSTLVDSAPVPHDLMIPRQLIRRSTEFCNLRTYLRQNPPKDLQSTMQALLKTDSDFAELQESMGPNWSYEIRYEPNKPVEVLEGFYFDYQSFWHATLYCNLRSMRLIVNQELLQYIEQASEDADEAALAVYDDMGANCRQNLKQITAEQCASLPYMLGLDDPVPFLPEEGSRPGIGPSIPAYAGYVMVWPLFLSATSPTAEPVLQRWVIQRLEHISKYMGIGLAHTVALVVKNQMVRVAQAKRIW